MRCSARRRPRSSARSIPTATARPSPRSCTAGREAATSSALVWVLHQMLERSGSIEQFFVEGDDPAAADVTTGLESFSRRAMALDLTRVYGRRPPGRTGVPYFFSRPSSGGACKRLNLYLRWMVRRDQVDLGVWTRVAPARLIVPLDTHVIRLGQCLRLTRYRGPGWRMAADITARLRALDPSDPVRFDFSLCHVGMMGNCGFGHKAARRASVRCGACADLAAPSATARRTRRIATSTQLQSSSRPRPQPALDSADRISVFSVSPWRRSPWLRGAFSSVAGCGRTRRACLQPSSLR